MSCPNAYADLVVQQQMKKPAGAHTPASLPAAFEPAYPS
jgi:hypothetical protein